MALVSIMAFFQDLTLVLRVWVYQERLSLKETRSEILRQLLSLLAR